jgi:hypothetical protein
VPPNRVRHYRKSEGANSAKPLSASKVAKVGLRFPACLGEAQNFPIFRFDVYNMKQLSLIHEQLKVGIANQRHPLTSSDSSQHNPKKQE